MPFPKYIKPFEIRPSPLVLLLFTVTRGRSSDVVVVGGINIGAVFILSGDPSLTVFTRRGRLSTRWIGGAFSRLLCGWDTSSPASIDLSRLASICRRSIRDKEALSLSTSASSCLTRSRWVVSLCTTPRIILRVKWHTMSGLKLMKSRKKACFSGRCPAARVI